ncbi:molybdopterin-guanine dinucleotide biosynthesis protein B [Paenibacillus sacheonensis]|uniref:Molybdopterin-guanine dinucleotide biosynthesis protein B n=1 Tax=Paenibacillus sacheonensis TaxID=742054 RepID=A0A7X4YWN8_9BACL|nr:molybdopterin-guanine dinucleotide biosynthesis protein B [Paenibacillus sacheonensis]MBM7569120.1 molybdopterin-guanine dinucleotide biosynthesis protein B [Paenibacillus sacheonensis]NBC72954.1 molybdopterin-guanine dinucleotide biosynthesis protein B [Paenibacillus sacheonensis]
MLSQFASRKHSNAAPLVIQVVGYKNSGKTTLIAKLIHHLKQADLVVGTVKHDAHDFDMDTPGTDTWKHQEAGADMTAISSAARSAIISNRPEPLSALLAYMQHADIVLVEGFKHEPYPKIMLLRNEQDKELLQLPNPWIAAVWPQAEALRPNIVLPAFSIDDDARIAAVIFDLLKLPDTL